MNNFTSFSKHFFVIVCLLICFNNCFSQPGTIDNTFGTNGTVLTKVYERRPSNATSVSLQGADKIIVAGGIEFDDHFRNAVLIRYNIDGKIDSSFGKNGVVLHTHKYESIGDDRFLDIKVLSDGKILALEQTDILNYENQFNVIRYLPDGKIDSTFAVDGIFSSRLDIAGLEIRTNNKDEIFVGGYLEKGADSVGCTVQKLKPNGLPDSSFGNNGLALLLEKQYFNRAYGFAFQSDGKIVMAGDSRLQSGTTRSMILRLNSNGSLDSSFATNGMLKEDFITPSTIETDKYDNIFITGYIDKIDNTTNTFTIVNKYDLNGAPVTDFGIAGRFIYDGIPGYQEGKAILIQEDGGLIVAGIKNPYQISGLLLKLKQDGSFDQSFGQSGVVINDSVAFNDAIQQADKKIVATGYKFSETPFSVKKFITTVRYNNDVVLPVSLLSFKGVQKQSSVLLTWQIQSTSKTTFNIERSTTGIDFIRIYSAKSISENLNSYTYQFEDKNVTVGKNYYRLQMIDEEGNITYSSIISFAFDEVSEVKIFPNPVTDYLNVKVAEKSIVTIFDLQGKIVLQKQIDSTGKIYVGNLSTGVYFINVNNKRLRFTKIN